MFVPFDRLRANGEKEKINPVRGELVEPYRTQLKNSFFNRIESHIFIVLSFFDFVFINSKFFAAQESYFQIKGIFEF